MPHCSAAGRALVGIAIKGLHPLAGAAKGGLNLVVKGRPHDVMP